jgi:hypothetical protein
VILPPLVFPALAYYERADNDKSFITTGAGKVADGSLNASKESIDKQESNKRMESLASKRSISSATKSDDKVSML